MYPMDLLTRHPLVSSSLSSSMKNEIQTGGIFAIFWLYFLDNPVFPGKIPQFFKPIFWGFMKPNYHEFHQSQKNAPIWVGISKLRQSRLDS